MGEESPADGYFKVYEEYSKTLRTWFVTYGIGAPVLLLNNESLRASVLASGHTELIAGLFLAGVALQVALTALNKAVAWILYAEIEAAAAAKRRAGANTGTAASTKRLWYRHAADWISEQFWIDLGVDILTGGAFVCGTFKIFSIAAGTG